MTTFVEKTGDLLESGADCLVNATNTRGVMGAGIAAQFRERWPEMFGQYRELAEIDSLYTASVHVWWNPAHLPDPQWAQRLEPRWIVNLHTKTDWRQPSRYLYVVGGLIDLRLRLLEDLVECRTIAIPALGCGLGGLDWKVAEVLIRDILGNVEETGRQDLEVWLYPPADGRPGEPLESGFGNWRPREDPGGSEFLTSEPAPEVGAICTCRSRRQGDVRELDPRCPWHGSWRPDASAD